MDVSMPSDDEQPHDSIRKRDVDPTDSERLQLYWYSQKHSKATQKELSLWFYTKFKKQSNYSYPAPKYTSPDDY